MNIIDWTNRLIKVGSLGNFGVGNIRKIIVHHDAQFRPVGYDNLARWNAQARLHISESQGRGGIQYHFKIDNAGEAYLLNPLGERLWHAANLDVNNSSIAICLDGYFHAPKNQKPTYEQYVGLKTLLDTLSQDPRFPADQDDVFGHREVAQTPTACCGDTFIGFVRDYRNAKGNVAIPRVPKNDGSMPPEAPAPVPTPVPVPPTTTRIGRRYVRFPGVKHLVVNKDTNLWQFDRPGWDFPSAKVLKNGEDFDAVGQAEHSNGGVYYMTDFSFGNADQTGSPAHPTGVNIVDLSAKPTPAPVPPTPTPEPPAPVPVPIPEPTPEPPVPTPPVEPTPVPTPTPIPNNPYEQWKEVKAVVEFIIGFIKRLTSRKFLLTVGTIFAINPSLEGSGLSDQLTSIISVVVKVAAVITYVIVEGLHDIQEV